MADTVPAKLRSLQLASFAKRAAQLEKFKPIITYWCEYPRACQYKRRILKLHSALLHSSTNHRRWTPLG
ncbi:DUF605-domain-containing protein [Alternaria alternata]|nr:DUF605-domain-containing protein [Alternaria alternata]